MSFLAELDYKGSMTTCWDYAGEAIASQVSAMDLETFVLPSTSFSFLDRSYISSI